MTSVSNIGPSGSNYPLDKSSSKIEEQQLSTSDVKGSSQSPVAAKAQVLSEKMAMLVEEINTNMAEVPDEDKFMMSQLLRLLIQMTKTLQDVAIVQAEQLSNTTAITRAYVNLQQKIPVLLKGGTSVPDDSERRGEMNNAFSIYMDSVRANKGTVEDLAKKIQALLNSTKEAGTQFSDLFSSILDQMNSLISQIYR